MANQIFSLTVIQAADLKKGAEILNLGKVSAIQKSGKSIIVYLSDCISTITKVVEFPLNTDVLLKNSTV